MNLVYIYLLNILTIWPLCRVECGYWLFVCILQSFCFVYKEFESRELWRFQMKTASFITIWVYLVSTLPFTASSQFYLSLTLSSSMECTSVSYCLLVNLCECVCVREPHIYENKYKSLKNISTIQSEDSTWTWWDREEIQSEKSEHV